jgi:hypothetical protein
MKKEIRKTVKQTLQMENSFGVIRKEEDVEIEFIVRLPKNHYGSFEMFDKETGGENWYAEGGLWFTGNELTDYDGVFSLSDVILNILKEHGYDVKEMKNTLAN